MELYTDVLALGLTARLTRLVVDDQIGAPLRARIISWRGPESQAAYLAQCPWCLGLWVAIAVAVAAWLSGGAAWFTVPALAATLSYTYGLLATRVEA